MISAHADIVFAVSVDVTKNNGRVIVVIIPILFIRQSWSAQTLAKFIALREITDDSLEIACTYVRFVITIDISHANGLIIFGFIPAVVIAQVSYCKA